METQSYTAVNGFSQSILRLPRVAHVVKSLPATQETWVQPLGQEDPLEKGKAAHSSILVWRIQQTESILTPSCLDGNLHFS